MNAMNEKELVQMTERKTYLIRSISSYLYDGEHRKASALLRVVTTDRREEVMEQVRAIFSKENLVARHALRANDVTYQESFDDEHLSIAASRQGAIDELHSHYGLKVFADML